MTSNYTYVLQCKDKSYYTGWTTELLRRVSEHQKGIGGKYTRAKRPVRLVYYEEFATKEEAMRREWEIKQLTRTQKERLIAGLTSEEQQNVIEEINAQVTMTD